MDFIDPRTFLFVANLLGIFCALVLWVLARSFPADIKGMRDWAAAVVLIAGASGLASMRGIFPDILSTLLSNALQLVGQLLLIVGLQRYAGRQPVWRLPLNAIGAVLVIIAWLTYGSHSYQGRIFVMSVAHIAFFSVGAFLAWRTQPTGVGSRLLAIAFALGVGVAVWRLATLSASVTETDDIFDRDLVQQAYLAMFSLGAIGLSIGFILLANERLRVELEFMATRDPMTATFNRRAFFSRAEIEWARAVRSGRPLSVITSDIDHFKRVNDTYGHHVGDLVIKDYAHRAGKMLRLSDILARFGGEEFVVLLPDTGLAEAKQVAQRIRREIEITRDKALPGYTVSLGVAAAQGKAGQVTDVEALIARADAALYRAKQNGRNQVQA